MTSVLCAASPAPGFKRFAPELQRGLDYLFDNYQGDRLWQLVDARLARDGLTIVRTPAGLRKCAYQAAEAGDTDMARALYQHAAEMDS